MLYAALTSTDQTKVLGFVSFDSPDFPQAIIATIDGAPTALIYSGEYGDGYQMPDGTKVSPFYLAQETVAVTDILPAPT